MDTAVNREFIAEPDTPLDDRTRFFPDTPQVSVEIGEAWAAARAPRTINPRRPR